MKHFGRAAFVCLLIFSFGVSAISPAFAQTSANPNIMPPVPAEFGVGAVVRVTGLPYTTIVEQVGDGIVFVNLLDNNTPKRVAVPWKSLTLVTAAPAVSITPAAPAAPSSPATPSPSGPTLGVVSCAAPITSRIVFGERNAQVLSLQKFLVGVGLLDEENTSGYFGPLTLAAVKKFQADNNIVSSGTAETTGYGAVGPTTKERINTRCGYTAAQVAAAAAAATPASDNTGTTSGTGTGIGSGAGTGGSSYVRLTATKVGANAVRLAWTSLGVTSCTSNDFYINSSLPSTSGSKEVPVSKTASYSILCANSVGTVQDYVTVTMVDGVITGTSVTGIGPATPATPNISTPPTGACGGLNQLPCAPSLNNAGCGGPGTTLRIDNGICCPLGQVNIAGTCRASVAGFKPNDWVVINSDNVRYRSSPALNASKVWLAPPTDTSIGTRTKGDKGYIARGPASGDGHTWWNIAYVAPDGYTPTGIGWTAEQYLTLTTRDTVVINPASACPGISDSKTGFMIYPASNAPGGCSDINSGVDSSIVIYRDIVDGKLPEAYGGSKPAVAQAYPSNVGADGYVPLTSGSCLAGYSVQDGITKSGVIGKVCRFVGVTKVSSNNKLQVVPVDASWFGGDLSKKQANIDKNYYEMTYPQAFNGRDLSSGMQAGNKFSTIGLMFRYAVAKELVSNTPEGYGTWSYWCGNSFGATSPQNVASNTASKNACMSAISEALTHDKRELLWNQQPATSVDGIVNAPRPIISALSLKAGTSEIKAFTNGGTTMYLPPDGLVVPASVSSVDLTYTLTANSQAWSQWSPPLSSCQYRIANEPWFIPTLPSFTTSGTWANLSSSTPITPPSVGGVYDLELDMRCADNSGAIIMAPRLRTKVTRLQAIDVAAIQKRGSLGTGTFLNYRPVSWGLVKLASINTIAEVKANPNSTFGYESYVLRVPVGSIQSPSASFLRPPQTFLCTGFFGDCSDNSSVFGVGADLDPYPNALAAVGATFFTRVVTPNGSGNVALSAPPWGAVFAVEPPSANGASSVLKMCYTQGDVTAGNSYLQDLSASGNPSPRTLATYHDPRLAAISKCAGSASSCVSTLNADVNQFNTTGAGLSGFTVNCN